MDGIQRLTDGPRLWPITADFYLKMIDAGLFDQVRRVELIEGQLIEMAPMGTEHSAVVTRLNRLLLPRVGERGTVFVQCPIRLNGMSEPEPDVAIAQPRADDYAQRRPTVADLDLLIEVSDSTLTYDLDVKAPLYARNGIVELWVVNVKARCIVVHREPAETGYGSVVTARAGKTREIEALPGVTLGVSELFG